MQSEHRSFRRSAIAGGFTLIELMISIAVASVVAVGIFAMLNGQSRAYRRQADMGSMQQNLRVAMEMLVRDISSAGAGAGMNGDFAGADGQGGNPAQPYYALQMRPNFPSTGVDAIELATVSTERPGRLVTDFWGIDAQCGSTDFIPVRQSMLGVQNFYTGQPGADRIVCSSTTGNSGRPVALVWQVLGFTPLGVSVVAAGGTNDYDAVCSSAQKLQRYYSCGVPRRVAYYIDKVQDGIGIGTAATPVLYFVPDARVNYPTPNDIPVALGIEDMQFSACNGRSSDCSFPANWFSPWDAVNSPASQWAELTSVRVSLSARSLREDAEQPTISTPYDIDPMDSQFPTATADAYHRRTATTQVTMRNAIGAFLARKAGW